jgi:hypothetical protein
MNKVTEMVRELLIQERFELAKQYLDDLMMEELDRKREVRKRASAKHRNKLRLNQLTLPRIT